ncbi:MAG: hypothetical protein ABL907_03545 [Hyphomicrobium sp.]
MSKPAIRALIAASALTMPLGHFGAAMAEDVAFKGTVTDVFGDRAVMEADGKKYLVNFGPRIKDVGTLKSGDQLVIDGDLKKSGEVRAHHVTTADGRKIEAGKDKKSWSEWLLGDDADDKPFTAADARKVATDKGYTLTSEPMGDRKHFVALATKDAKAFEINIHRDGNVVEKAPYAAADAKKAAIAKGYDVMGEPAAMKQHYEMLARKEGQFFELHANRDGEVKVARTLDKTDPRWGAQIP